VLAACDACGTLYVIVSARSPRSAPARASARQLRIIGGRWRGRRFRFPAAEIRPTPDRVRETLFNWLMARISGARCLDLYAGSGALGLEALSRGAAAVQFVERDAAACRALRELLAAWEAVGAQVQHTSAEQYLASAPQSFDIAFLDPPFAAGALTGAARALEAGGWIRPGGVIYVEHARRDALPALPQGFQPLRSGAAGEVGYHLFEFQPRS
jgi:16S rRNA (guanine966-N2)-methyltransferase